MHSGAASGAGVGGDGGNDEAGAAPGDGGTSATATPPPTTAGQRRGGDTGLGGKGRWRHRLHHGSDGAPRHTSHVLGDGRTVAKAATPLPRRARRHLQRQRRHVGEAGDIGNSGDGAAGGDGVAGTPGKAGTLDGDGDAPRSRRHAPAGTAEQRAGGLGRSISGHGSNGAPAQRRRSATMATQRLNATTAGATVATPARRQRRDQRHQQAVGEVRGTTARPAARAQPAPAAKAVTAGPAP